VDCSARLRGEFAIESADYRNLEPAAKISFAPHLDQSSKICVRFKINTLDRFAIHCANLRFKPQNHFANRKSWRITPTWRDAVFLALQGAKLLVYGG
jgi:hypothetical protein